MRSALFLFGDHSQEGLILFHAPQVKIHYFLWDWFECIGLKSLLGKRFKFSEWDLYKVYIKKGIKETFCVYVGLMLLLTFCDLCKCCVCVNHIRK